MSERMIQAASTFRRFLTLTSTGKSQWMEIPEGTPGIESDGVVTFELKDGDTGSAPVKNDITSSLVVLPDLLRDA